MRKILFGLCLLLIPSFLFADMKVSNMNEQLTPKTTDQMYIVANSTSMKVTVGTLLNAGTWYVTISSQEASNVVNQGQYLFVSSAAASNLVNQGQYMFISSQAASNLVNQGQYLFSSSQAASNLVNQGQYLFSSVAGNTYLTISSQAASNLVNQGQYLFKSSAASTYAPLVGGVIQNFYIDGSSITKAGILTAGANITLTPGAGITTIASSGGGSGDNLGTHVATKTITSTFGASLSTLTITSLNCTSNANGGALTTDASGNLVCSDDASGAGGTGTTIRVEDGGAGIVDTSTINFTGAEFIVTDDGGESLVKLNQSSVTMLGADPAVAGDVSGTLSVVVVTDDSHAHTGTTISGIDISDDTNLAVTAPVVLTGDTLSLDASVATYSSVYSTMSVSYLGISSTPWTATMLSQSSAAASNLVNQGQYLFSGVAANTYLTISSQTASNVVNQGQYVFMSSQAASNLVNQGQYMFVSSQAASNLVDQGQYLQKSSASVSYLGISSAPSRININSVVSGTMTFNVSISSGATWDSDAIRIFQAPQNRSITILSLYAEIPSGTSLTFNIEERAVGSLGSAGTDILAADVAADTTGEIRQVFSNASIAAGAHLVFTTGASAASGAVPYISIQIGYSLD